MVKILIAKKGIDIQILQPVSRKLYILSVNSFLSVAHTRVRFQGQDQGKDEYLNANYVDGFRKANAYIATQGPMKNTEDVLEINKTTSEAFKTMLNYIYIPSKSVNSSPRT